MIHVLGPPRPGITTPHGHLCLDLTLAAQDALPGGHVVFHVGLANDAGTGDVCEWCRYVVPMGEDDE